MLISFFTYIYLFILSFLPIQQWSYGVIGEPSSFLHSSNQLDSEKTVSNLVFRRLVNVDYKTGDIQKDLLDSYKILENGSIYELRLKKGQYWHDGVEITADDLLYTAAVSGNLKEVSSDKVDTYTVRFTLPQIYSPFLSILNIPVLPAHLSEKNSKTLPVGSGDYRVVRVKRDRAVINEVTLMTLNSKMPFKKIIVRFYKDEDSLRLAAKQYEINSFFLNGYEKFEKFNSIETTFYSRSYVLIFNTKKDYLTREVRQKIANSIDLNELISAQEYKSAKIPIGPFSGTWAQNGELFNTNNFSPTTIKLDKSIKIIAPNIRQARLMAENIKQQLSINSNIGVSITYLETKDFKTKVRDYDYDAVLMAQEYGVDPDRYVFWHSSQNTSGLNYSNFSSIRIDKSIEEAREELTVEKRKSHYNIFQSVFAEEYPAIYLIHPTQYFYYSEFLKEPFLRNVYYPYEIFDYLDKWILKPNPKIF